MWNPYHLFGFCQVGMKLAQGISVGRENHVADRKAPVPLMLCGVIPRMQVVHECAFEAVYPSQLRLTRPQQLIASPEQHDVGKLAEPRQQFGFERPWVRPQLKSLNVLPSISGY